METSFRGDYEVVTGGFATPHRLASAPSGVGQELSGCVFDADGMKIALSERFSGFRGDRVATVNPDRVRKPREADHLAGRGVYLGHFMGGYYGHFITETLSTFWIFDRLDPNDFDYVLFHPFTSGTTIPEYAKYCLERMGVGVEKVRFVTDRAVAFDELVVPERLLRLNHSADPRLRSVYAKITADVRLAEEPSGRIYLSRRRLSRRKFERVIANEVRIEQLFRGHGFDIVYPEQTDFATQLRLYSNARVVAGASGSSLHNSVFMREGSLAIELGDPRYGGERAPTQMLCDEISGVRNLLIPFAGRRFGVKKTMLFDIRAIERALADVEDVPPRDRRERGSAMTSLKDVPEVLYLSIRPSLGAYARAALGRR